MRITSKSVYASDVCGGQVCDDVFIIPISTDGVNRTQINGRS